MFSHQTQEEGMVQVDEIPEEGISHETLLDLLSALRRHDVTPSEGRAWAYVYDAGDDHTNFVISAHNMFIHTNALNPMAFSSLRKMENDVIRMACALFHGTPGEVCGTMSSGGTESLLLMIKTYRDRARALHPEIKKPEVLLCKTAHPAICKGCHYFGVDYRLVDFDTKSMKLDVDDMARKITRNTILLIASAPQYPHGIIDPIEEVAELAQKHNLPLHVDACIGGFILPWVEMLGYKLDSKFDFRIPGVTSISADVHKYGFSAKGASVILYRNLALRRFQFYGFSSWPGGLYISSTMLGTRGGGPIAGAWASMMSLGKDGFCERARVIMETATYLREEIEKVESLDMIGNPQASLISFRSVDPKVNILAVADVLEDHGWHMERQQLPDCIHMTVMPQHAPIREQFIRDLHSAVEKVLHNPELNKSGSAAMYGMLAKIPSDTMVEDFLDAFMDKLYS